MLRVFQHYVSARKLGYFAAETATLALAATLGAGLGAWTWATPGGAGPAKGAGPWVYLVLAVAVAALVQGALYLMDLYDLRVAQSDRSRGERLLRATGGAVAIFSLVMVMRLSGGTGPLPVGATLGAAVGALCGLLLVRGALPGLMGAPQAVLVVGGDRAAQAAVRALEESGEGAWRAIPVSASDARGTRLASLARTHQARHVVLSPGAERDSTLSAALLTCRLQGCDVYEAGAFCERTLRRLPVDCLRATDLEQTSSGAGGLPKRIFDVVMAGTLLVLALPVGLLVAAIIRLTDGGPVFYRQERVGQWGRSYRLWKFRSMRTDAERDGAVWARANDDRITPIGRFIRKTRIDEIPQVLNVLLGDMSFVGPRPERGVFVEQLKTQIPFYAHREAVKPGITGWAQIRYPYGASVEDARNKLEYDLYYVRNASLFLDMAIIFHTVRHVLTARGAR